MNGLSRRRSHPASQITQIHAQAAVDRSRSIRLRPQGVLEVVMPTRRCEVLRRLRPEWRDGMPLTARPTIPSPTFQEGRARATGLNRLGHEAAVDDEVGAYHEASGLI